MSRGFSTVLEKGVRPSEYYSSLPLFAMYLATDTFITRVALRSVAAIAQQRSIPQPMALQPSTDTVTYGTAGYSHGSNINYTLINSNHGVAIPNQISSQINSQNQNYFTNPFAQAVGLYFSLHLSVVDFYFFVSRRMETHRDQSIKYCTYLNLIQLLDYPQPA